VQHLPEAKLIYIVRDPVKRVESHYVHKIREGVAMPPLVDAVRSSPHLIDTSLYWKQINVYRAHYPDARILALFFEDFQKDPYPLLRRCFEFLEVDPAFHPVDAEEPQHVSADTQLDTATLKSVRHMPGFGAVRRLVPEKVRSAIAR